MKMTYENILKDGEKKLKESEVPEASLSAWYLFSEVFQMEKSKYYIEKDIDFSILCKSRQEESLIKEKIEIFNKFLARRCKREPLEHILGYTEFMGMKFYVSKDVLIPRQDTEILVEEVLKYSKDKEILDLCTGSGCIGISLWKMGACKSVTLSDISKKALEITKKNQDLNKAKVDIVYSDLFENIEKEFDIIVSNPPYIASKTIEELMPEVKDFEPIGALDGKEDGLFFYEKISKEAPQKLKDKGMIFFEIGFDQARDVSEILKKNNFKNIQVIKDYAGMDRLVKGEI